MEGRRRHRLFPPLRLIPSPRRPTEFRSTLSSSVRPLPRGAAVPLFGRHSRGKPVIRNPSHRIRNPHRLGDGGPGGSELMNPPGLGTCCAGHVLIAWVAGIRIPSIRTAKRYAIASAAPTGAHKSKESGMSNVGSAAGGYRVENPATGEVVEKFDNATDAEVQQVLESAQIGRASCRERV